MRLSLRFRLLLLFSSIALVALSFFAYVTYDTARSGSIEKETQLMKMLLGDRMVDIHESIKMSAGAQTITDRFSEQLPPGFFLYITTEGNALPAALSGSDNQPDISRVVGAGKKSGQLLDSGKLYTWFSEPLDDSSRYLTAVHAEDALESQSFVSQMGASLLIAAFLTLWVSAWGALYLAKLLETLNKQKDELAHQALHDGLTGLPNRRLLQDRLQQALFVAERQLKPQALLFIDLNGFKAVNDNLGHHRGDVLLQSVATILESCVRKSDTVSRLGGDEFAILLKDVDAGGAEVVARKISDWLDKPLFVEGEQCFVSGSIGIALYPEHADSSEELIKCADKAMYLAKENKSHYEYYSTDTRRDQGEHYKLIHELRQAIDEGHFVLNYQPKYDIVNKIVIGAEALIRWNHPVRGIIAPDVFIALAEKTGLIRRITYWVLEQAFNDHLRMSARGFDIALSVNLSVHNLQDPQFLSQVKELVAKTGCNPSKFVLEITESAVVNQLELLCSVLKELQALGFQISIDDFGTGYSSFVNLKELPVDEIKIDRSFVFNSAGNHYDASIVRATVEIGKSFGICVVAEGVETEEALVLLEHLGCGIAQGYLFSRPLEFEAFLAWLAHYSLPHQAIRTLKNA